MAGEVAYARHVAIGSGTARHSVFLNGIQPHGCVSYVAHQARYLELSGMTFRTIQAGKGPNGLTKITVRICGLQDMPYPYCSRYALVSVWNAYA